MSVAVSVDVSVGVFVDVRVDESVGDRVAVGVLLDDRVGEAVESPPPVNLRHPAPTVDASTPTTCRRFTIFYDCSMY